MPKKSKVRKCEDWEGEMPPGIAPRVAVSIGVFFGWLSFLILFLAFYADGFSIYQNLAIFLTSILAALAILAPIWVHYGMITEHARKKKTRKRSTRK